MNSIGKKIDIASSRLREPLNWFPYPALISVSLLMLLMGHVLSGLNIRTGNPAEVVNMSAPSEREGSIWLSISMMDQKTIVAMTGDRKIYRWDVDNPTEGVNKIRQYLQKRQYDLIMAAALAKRIDKTSTKVVFAVDRHIKFKQFYPLLTMLSQVGIDNYAFEVRQPL